MYSRPFNETLNYKKHLQAPLSAVLIGTTELLFTEDVIPMELFGRNVFLGVKQTTGPLGVSASLAQSD